MTTLYFQRHGEYTNPYNILPLRTPRYALSEKGEKDIKELANDFYKSKNIAAIYSSMVLRCRQTAAIINDVLKVPLHHSEFLVELGSPYLQGVKNEWFEQQYKTKSFYTDPKHINSGGESIDEVFERMNEIVQRILNDHKNQSVILVSHADPIMIYTSEARNIDLDENVRLHKQVKYIPMGGTIEMVYNSENKVVDFKEHYK